MFNRRIGTTFSEMYETGTDMIYSDYGINNIYERNIREDIPKYTMDREIIVACIIRF